jgi:hypothetical protein
VLTRCRGYKTALWQKMVFKVNLDWDLKSSNFRRRPDKGFGGDVIELLPGNLSKILPSLTEKHSIPALQFELFAICRTLQASRQFPHRNLRQWELGMRHFTTLIESSETAFFREMCYYQLTLRGYKKLTEQHSKLHGRRHTADRCLWLHTWPELKEFTT